MVLLKGGSSSERSELERSFGSSSSERLDCPPFGRNWSSSSSSELSDMLAHCSIGDVFSVEFKRQVEECDKLAC